MRPIFRNDSKIDNILLKITNNFNKLIKFYNFNFKTSYFNNNISYITIIIVRYC